MNDCTLCYPNHTCPWCLHLQDADNQAERSRFWARYDAHRQADPFYAHGDHGEHAAPEWHPPSPASPHW